MLSFILASFFLLITPGPGVLTTAGAGSAFGFSAGLRYMVGVVLGSLIVMAAVASGLAAFVLSYPPVRYILLGGSLLYLLYLAWRIATTGSGVAIREADRPLRFWNGIALSVINPKAYAVMTTLFSGFPFYPDSALVEGLIKAAVFASISLPIHTLWLFLGVTLKRLALGAGVSRAVNIAMAVSMLAVVALALYSSI